MQVTGIAKTLADAKAYLVNRLTKQVTVNGESKQLRIISDRDFFPLRERPPAIENVEDLMLQTATYQLEFWDRQHGLMSGEEISVELQSEGSREFASVLEGTVLAVDEHKVSVAGTERLVLKDTAER